MIISLLDRVQRDADDLTNYVNSLKHVIITCEARDYMHSILTFLLARNFSALKEYLLLFVHKLVIKSPHFDDMYDTALNCLQTRISTHVCTYAYVRAHVYIITYYAYV